MTTNIDDILKLPLDEKLEIMEKIWQSIQENDKEMSFYCWKWPKDFLCCFHYSTCRFCTNRWVWFSGTGRDAHALERAKLAVGKTDSAERAAFIGEEVEALYANGPAGEGGVRKYVNEMFGIVYTLIEK